MARRLLTLLCLALLLTGSSVSRAQLRLQFDVFPGYDAIVPEAAWVPIVIEADNEGPSFTGVIEVSAGNMNEDQPRRFQAELPTGTLKRFVIPVFSASRQFGTWDVRLLNERGKVVAEQTGLRPRAEPATGVPILGALGRTAGGAPEIRRVLPADAALQPVSARLQPSIFPDNPLVLEGMDALYLNSARAPELSVTQVRALMAWLNEGGHLIVGVEQVSDVTSTTWLDHLFPLELHDIQSVSDHPELQEWIKMPGGSTNSPYANAFQNPAARRAQAAMNARQSQAWQRRYGMAPPAQTPDDSASVSANPFSGLAVDETFESNALLVATGKLRDGRAVVASGDTPLIVTADRGRGRVTALLFSPEREPFRSWKNQPTFWARMLEVPVSWYVSADLHRNWGWSTDAVFGAMIETRQVHKLPIGWLLVLLIVYLAVIGPLDQVWLKRIGKPMLTWITFPCYVVLFSLLIYFIGYKLRAGESEWNELNIVDVLPRGDDAELRGRTYASIYSPVNQKYWLQGEQPYATLRGEFSGTLNPGQSSERATLWQEGDAFKAEIFVPVWTSQLFVSDWLQPASMPLAVTLTPEGDGWRATVENKSSQKLTGLRMVVNGSVFTLGDLPVDQTVTNTLSKQDGTPLREFVRQHGQTFADAVQARQRTFGAMEGGHIEDLPNSSMAVSFISMLAANDDSQRFENFISPPGLDLSPVVEHGNAVLLAWAGDYAPAKPMCQFSTRRTHRDTLWRIAVPIKQN